jgi:IclR family transcriptional regulator, KDG regulon repressor
MKARGDAAGTQSADLHGKYKIEAVSRAVLVLDTLRQQPGGVSVEAVAKHTDLSEALVRATLETLRERRLVRMCSDQPKEYELGLAWLRLAEVKRRQLDIRDIARPVMHRMRDAVNETVALTIRIGANRVNIDYAESDHEVRRITQPGFHVPLHVGAAGRALMTGMDDSEIDAYLGQQAKMSGARGKPASKAKLMAEIRTARRTGLAVVIGEITADTAAVSAPVRNHVGEVVAALSISCPQDRFGPQACSRLMRELKKGARDVSAALGYEVERAD